MPISTLLAAVIIIAMFASFLLGLGGVTLWMALAERADRTKAAPTQVTQAVEPQHRRAA